MRPEGLKNVMLSGTPCRETAVPRMVPVTKDPRPLQPRWIPSRQVAGWCGHSSSTEGSSERGCVESGVRARGWAAPRQLPGRVCLAPPAQPTGQCLQLMWPSGTIKQGRLGARSRSALHPSGSRRQPWPPAVVCAHSMSQTRGHSEACPEGGREASY